MADDENAPATKKDLAALEERLSEQIRDMQTEILKALLPWQESIHSIPQTRGQHG